MISMEVIKMSKRVIVIIAVLVTAIVSVVFFFTISNKKDVQEISVDGESTFVEDEFSEEEDKSIGTTDNIVIENSKVIEPVVSDEMGDVYEYSEDTFDIETVQSYFNDTLPWETEVVFVERKDFGNESQLVYSAKNTDAVLILNYDLSMLVDDIEYETVPINKYGSDYSIVLFENGVPDNAEKIYDVMFKLGVGVDYFRTEYVSGSEVILTRESDNEVFIINLEE